MTKRRCCSICYGEGHNSRTCSAQDPSGQSYSPEETLGLPCNLSSSRPQVPVADATATGINNSGNHPNTKGVRWSAEEHLNFLRGLQALGDGAWKAISEGFVKTRTANQIASHAQKYHKRTRNSLRRKRNPSIFDVGKDEFPPLPPYRRMQRFHGDTGHHLPPPQNNQLNPLPPPPVSTTRLEGRTGATSRDDSPSGVLPQADMQTDGTEPSRDCDPDERLIPRFFSVR
ncbi:hypothetical protein MLD38_005379 [Melastoma candidum]|uniref:Uncharacterized protein n=1 Tax=Melastoma candidum TaxID=119954 RepID=A0ACB9S9X5_9MYRT|nr:hypothetical protein MLD38_005379 [Melastoma candidum]